MAGLQHAPSEFLRGRSPLGIDMMAAPVHVARDASDQDRCSPLAVAGPEAGAARGPGEAADGPRETSSRERRSEPRQPPGRSDPPRRS